MRARDNPFSVERVAKFRYRFDETESMPGIWQAWQNLERRASIVGPPGTGKTTLLEDFARHAQQQGYSTRWLQLSQSHPAPMSEVLKWTDNLASQHIALIDGAETATRWNWKRILRRCDKVYGILVTSHSPGRLPTLHTCQPDRTRLNEILEFLVPDATDHLVRIAHAAYDQHQGNLRETLRALYDHVGR